MNKYNKAIAIFLLSFFIPSLCAPLMGAVITVRSGTFINLESIETYNSEDVSSGQRISFRVLNDLNQDGAVIIKAGARATGRIQTVDETGILGKPGEISISLVSVTAVDNTEIPISASKVYKGKNKQTTALIIGLFLCFLALFMKGGEAALQSGSVIEAQIIGSPQVTVP